jgi:chromosomal replication initiation ATPase DnaA
MDIGKKYILKKSVSAVDIKNLVEKELQIPDIGVKTRTRELSQARFIYFKLAKNLCRYKSLSAIGRAVNRDHATVINGLKKYNVEARIDRYMDDVYDDLKEIIEEKFSLNKVKYKISIDELIKKIEQIEIKLNKLENEKNN